MTRLLPLVLLLSCAESEPDEPVEAPPETPQAPTVDELLIELDRTEMARDDGSLHRGYVAQGGDTTHIPGLLGPGVYSLELLGRSTEVQEGPAELSLHHHGGELVRITVDPGQELRRAQASFEVGPGGASGLVLRFDNDFYDPPRDRNVELQRLRILRHARPSPAERAQALRDDLAGKDLLLVSLDTVRADRLSTYGHPRPTSPHLTALAEGGWRAERAWSASRWTAPSHATMLTGLHPEQHGVGMQDPLTGLPDEAPTLAERLKSAGYRTGGFVEGWLVTETLGFHRGFDTWREARTRCDATVDAALAWLDEDHDGPSFAFVHTYEAQAPYAPPPVDRTRFVDPLPADVATWDFIGDLPTPTAEEVHAVAALYDAGLLATDACLGRLVEGLAEQDRLERTLVVVTSDHGEELWEHGQRGHGQLVPETLHVPLVLSHPALVRHARATEPAPVGAVDLVPTVLDLLGHAGDEALPGRSLVGRMTTTHPDSAAIWATDEDELARWSDARIWVGDGQANRVFEAGEERDPTELPAARLDFEEQARARRERLAPLTPGAPAALAEPTVQELQALGYVGL